ncbi:MAG: DUF2256 domain-containing protein [Oceanospirillales bacterium LUC14_002_19_P2]|nr:MAG: DUF2256 domain-containing protein [Oceanospirillales bacterium LUC14_002_19_P2]
MPLVASQSESHNNTKDVKTCAVCQRPFTWRKKWTRCWEQVRYCSERCRRNRNRVGKS